MYTDLKSYQQALIIHDFTVEFVKQCIDVSYKTYQSYKTYSRQADQMIQAARSGKQNIAEATANSKQKAKGETFLLGVASASLKELLEDYKDFLRQHNLPIWGRDDARALAVRGLAYNRSDMSDGSYKTYQTYKTYEPSKAYAPSGPYKTYETYKTYLTSPESAANAMLCLINQTTYLLDQQIKGVQEQQRKNGLVVGSRNARVGQMLAEQRKKETEIDELIKGNLSDL